MIHNRACVEEAVKGNGIPIISHGGPQGDVDARIHIFAAMELVFVGYLTTAMYYRYGQRPSPSVDG